MITKECVLVVGKFYVEGWAVHIAQTLEDFGFEIVRLDPRPTLIDGGGNFGKFSNALYDIYLRSPNYEKAFAKKLLRVTEDKNVKLVIVCHDFLTPRQVKALKQHTLAKVVMWFPDAVLNFGKSMFLVSDYDAIYFKDTYLVSKIKDDYGIDAHYLPECCNPLVHRPVQLTSADLLKYGCDITTAGNFNAPRMAILSHLLNYRIKVWGPPVPHWADDKEVLKLSQREFVAYEEKAKAFLGSKIVLNSIHLSEINGINVRTFEIAATGAFQLASYKKDLELLFDVDKEIITFKNIGELKEKIAHYLNKEDERKRIGELAMNRVLREHTYAIRLKRMLSELKLRD